MLTKFQQKAYNIVKKIPKGKVLTYKEVAGLIGSPRAYRAVGNALNRAPALIYKCGGKNPFKEVPCHRVIRSDGKIGGYAYGSKTKIALLKSEGIVITFNKVMESGEV